LTEARRATLLDALAAHQPADEQEAAALDRIIEFVKHSPAPFARSTLEGHITGSAVVMTADGRFLVLYHRKLGRWLQPGGHSDAEDASTLATALREAGEESGLADFEPAHDGAILDVDAHEIPARGTEPAHVHYDIRYLLITQGADAAHNAEEAEAARWITFAEINDLNLDASLRRALRKAAGAA
jgi:8-oxo-dGTP pyrophosphatase MutT (NUDIX family)